MQNWLFWGFFWLLFLAAKRHLRNLERQIPLPLTDITVKTMEAQSSRNSDVKILVTPVKNSQHMSYMTLDDRLMGWETHDRVKGGYVNLNSAAPQIIVKIIPAMCMVFPCQHRGKGGVREEPAETARQWPSLLECTHPTCLNQVMRSAVGTILLLGQQRPGRHPQPLLP